MNASSLPSIDKQNNCNTDSLYELKASKELLEAVFETSTLGIHVLESIRDDHGSIVDFRIKLTNKMSDQIARKKVAGARMLEEWPHTKTIGLFDKFVAAVESGSHVDYEQRYDGDGVTAWFRWLASKLNDGLYVTIEDISSRKKYEEDLKETANNLQSTFDGVPAIITLLKAKYHSDGDPVDFTISSANKSMADFSPFTVEELVGKSLADVYPEAFRGELRQSYLDVLKSGVPTNLEFFYKPAKKWFSVYVTRQIEGHGIVAVAIDITSKKDIEENQRKIEVLTTLDKLKTEFFGNISHEFRTPLTLMLGPLEDVIAFKPIPSRVRSKLEMVQRNTLRLQKLVNSLLDFTRMESGRVETVFHPTDLSRFTTLLAKNFDPVFERAGIAFNIVCEEGCIGYVNRNMWEKIVFNLLSNALKFTLKGKVQLRLQQKRKHLHLYVTDTGVGISESNLSRVFERFVRIENVKARTFEGSGIGLALIKEIVEIHGGTIRVKSKVLTGTEFIVSIPKGKQHLPARMIHESRDLDFDTSLSSAFKEEVFGWLPGDRKTKKRIHDTPGRPTILLVDDNADLRTYIKNILDPDFDVIESPNGLEAVDLIKGGLLPDLILADVMMPEMNGYELIKALKSDESLPKIPFIFLSARASMDDRILGLRNGADNYLSKPFAADELLAIVQAKTNFKEPMMLPD